MQAYTEVKKFKLTQEPIVKSNLIIIHAMDSSNARHKCIYFPGYRDAETTNAIKALEANQKVMLEGAFKPDRRTNEMQFVISAVSNAKEEQSVTDSDAKYAIDPAVDFIVGGLSSYNKKPISMSEPREGRKQYYTDGDYYWYKDHPNLNEKIPTSF